MHWKAELPVGLREKHKESTKRHREAMICPAESGIIGVQNGRRLMDWGFLYASKAVGNGHGWNPVG